MASLKAEPDKNLFSQCDAKRVSQSQHHVSVSPGTLHKAPASGVFDAVAQQLLSLLPPGSLSWDIMAIRQR